MWQVSVGMVSTDCAYTKMLTRSCPPQLVIRNRARVGVEPQRLHLVHHQLRNTVFDTLVREGPQGGPLSVHAMVQGMQRSYNFNEFRFVIAGVMLQPRCPDHFRHTSQEL